MELVGDNTVDGNQYLSTTTGITAAGSTQGTATALLTDINNVTTVAAGTGIVLPALGVGSKITVLNNGANDLLVYPPSGATIDNLSANTAFSLAVAMEWTGAVVAANTWQSTDPTLAGTTNQTIVSEAAGAITIGLPSTLVAPGSVAYTTTLYNVVTTYAAAGSSQVTATPINSRYSNVTSGATSSGVIFPSPTQVGQDITVFNNTSNTILIYPQVGGSIDNFGINSSESIPPGNYVTYTALTTTNWNSVVDYYTPGQGINITGDALITVTNANATTSAAVAAAGTTQGTATQVTSSFNIVTSGTGGVSFFNGSAGLIITIVNETTASILVYPQSGAAIDSLGTNNPLLLPVGGSYSAQAISSTQWYTISPISISPQIVTNIGLTQAIHINMAMP